VSAVFRFLKESAGPSICACGLWTFAVGIFFSWYIGTAVAEEGNQSGMGKRKSLEERAQPPAPVTAEIRYLRSERRYEVAGASGSWRRFEFGYLLSRWQDSFELGPGGSVVHATMDPLRGVFTVSGDERWWKARANYFALVGSLELQSFKKTLTLSLELAPARKHSLAMVAKGSDLGMSGRGNLGFRYPVSDAVALGARTNASRAWATGVGPREESWRLFGICYVEWDMKPWDQPSD
jgi:hypothetical protein